METPHSARLPFKIAGYLLAVTIVIAVAIFAVNYYNRFHTPLFNSADVLPEDVVLFLEIKNPGDTWKKLSQRSALWEELCKTDKIASLHRSIASLDSSIRSSSSRSAFLLNQHLTIASVPTETSSFDMLYIIEFRESIDPAEADRIVRAINGENSIILKEPYKKSDIAYVNIAAFTEPFKYTAYSNLIISGFNEQLIKNCIDRIREGKRETKNAELTRVRATAGKNVDANLYLHLQKADGLLHKLLSEDYGKRAIPVSNFATWTELDVIIKYDEFLLNGYTATPDTGGSYLDVFRHEPHGSSLSAILPYNTRNFKTLSIAEIEQYLDEYRHYLHKTGRLAAYNENLSGYSQLHGFDIENLIIPLVGNEVSIAMVAGDGKSDVNIPYGIIRIMDVNRAKNMLEEVVVSLPPDHNTNATEYDYQIRKLPSGNLMETLFGKAFSAITENYAVVLKEYLILANTPADLIHLINAFYTQKTLDDNFNFQTFSENISDKSNMLLYCNIRKSIPDIASLFNPSLSAYIRANKPVFQNLEGLAVQFSFINDMFFTNAYLKFNPDYREVNPSNWIAEVDARITGKPHLVRDHRSGKRNIIVFDELNTMYLIDHQGAVKWKIPLMQQPISEVFMVDAYKNRKIQFLFNTPEYLYMIDIDGNYVSDFPVKLPVRATNGIAVFDYDKLKDYRIVFTGADNRIYNFDTRGNQVDGWNKPHVNQTVTVPIQHIAADGKDFIVATDEKGAVYIYNRRGEVRITPEKSLQKAPNSIFYANKTNSKGALITTDRQGNLCYLNLNGKISKTSFGDFSEGHFFLYTDFNNDNSFDFLFFDHSRLVVFDRMQKSITEQTVSESLLPHVELFDMAGKHKTIGVVGKETGKVYLFNQGGAFEPSGYISGQTPFAAGSLNNDNFTNLVICEENKVFSYRLD